MKEIVICAAVRATNGYIVRGHRHHNALHTLKDIPNLKYGGRQEDQGFVTSFNRYVTRKEGYDVQIAAGIPSALEGTEHSDGAYLHGELYSEDLY
jgi:hypothetical protein